MKDPILETFEEIKRKSKLVTTGIEKFNKPLDQKEKEKLLAAAASGNKGSLELNL